MEEEKKEEIFQTPSQFESRLARKNTPGGNKKYLVIIISIIVLGLVLFGVVKFFTGGENSELAVEPTPVEETFPTDIPIPTEEPDVTPTEQPTPTVTPKPTVNPIDKASGLDRSGLSVRILNGSGVGGAAKKASDYLEGLGYNIIQIGNAENSDYTSTEIQIKSASSEFLALLKKDLSSNYTVGSTSATPAASETADALVIIGK